MGWIDRLAHAIGRLLAWGFVVIALIMTWEVGARYLAGAPTIWVHEVAGLLAGVAFIFGGAVVMADGDHMRITLLADRLPPRARRWLEGMSLCIGALYLGGMALAAWSMSQRALFRFTADGTWRPERSGTSWNTPAPGLLKFALCVGAALFLLVILRRAVALLRGADR